MHYGKTPLQNLVTEEGKWGWNEAYSYAQVIKWWDVKPPSLFFEYSIEDQAYMIVVYQTEMKMAAWQQKLDKIEQNKLSVNSGSSED